MASQGTRRTQIQLHGILLASCLLSSVTYAGTTAEPNLRLVTDKNGIKVWTYQVPGNPVFHYKASTIVNTNLNALVSLVQDNRNASRWIPYVRQFDVIDPLDSQGHYRMRLELDMPFPIQDRDIVTSGQVTQLADGTVSITGRSIVDSRVPPRSGITRITQYEGRWTFKPIGKNQVEVTIGGFAHPGGAIPLTFVNMLVKQQPYETLVNLRKMIATGAYQQAKVTAMPIRERY